ncbi:MAG: Skp family chaperone for outer membrane protein [Phycisphaerales bacterium]|jgi:Skp family chaperone for outer membrane proteins
MNTTPSTRSVTILGRGLAVLALGVAVTLAWTVNASSRPPATPTAVATVDLVTILSGLEEKQVLEAKLQVSLNSRQQQLDELVKQLEVVQADLKTLAPGTDAYREKVRQLVELRNLAQTRQQILEQIISAERAEMLRGLYIKITASVARISERDGWDIVLMDDSAFPLPQGDVSDRDMERAIVSRLIVYRHESVMITDSVVTLMNNEYQAP